MTIQFAAARRPRASLAVRFLAPRALAAPANDNGETLHHDTALREALKLFAEHGLGAAEQARIRAERAFFAGDREAYRRWVAICRTLDRRMAACIAARVATGPR